MQADYSVELGAEDPVLEIPWLSDDAAVRYYAVRGRPDLVCNIPEARTNPDLGAFLGRINAPGFPLYTAKCDAWCSSDISAEEEIFGATHKFTCYIDLVFTDDISRASFPRHEAFARTLCKLLQHVPEMAASIEMVIRRCFCHDGTSDHKIEIQGTPGSSPDTSTRAFCFTAYVSGFGDKEGASKQWSIALKLLQHALVQVSQD